MASSKRIELDNNHVMDSKDAISLIKNYFSEGLASLALKKEYIDPTGYWGIGYGNENVDIFLESGRGFLEWNIELDNHKVILKDLDENVGEVKASSKINIEFILSLIKKAISAK